MSNPAYSFGGSEPGRSWSSVSVMFVTPGDGTANEVGAWFTTALQAIARGDSESVDTYFHSVGNSALLDETRTNYRTHWLVQDAHGRPMVNALVDRLARHVVDFAIPRTRILEALAEMQKSGSTYKVSMLEAEAKSYFSRLEQSGEGGELLLYFLMEFGLGIPQILCKMPHKTNTNMMIHGVDGVHAQALDDGRLAVYWGESKIYASFDAAASACFDSIAPYLLDDGGGPLKQDLLLARDHVDAGSRELSLKLAEYFTQDNPMTRKLVYRGACLVGFGYDNFAAPYSEEGAISDAAAGAIAGWSKKVGSRVVTRKIDAFEIEFFCLPIPSAEDFRRRMRAALGMGD